jgi:hypothetical protein
MKKPTMQPFGNPSKLPSSQPTVVPSLSHVKTYLNISKLERIPLIDVAQNRTSIRVLATVSQKGDVYIHCGAFPVVNGAATFPSSIEAILQQHFWAFSTDISTAVDLTALTPSSLYDVYCVSTSLQGISSPFDETFIRLSTGCCKTITIDGSLLTNQYARSIVNDAITVSVSALPSKSLSLTLSLQNIQNSSDNSIMIIPSSYDISFGSITKTFISAVLAGHSGLYRLSAVLRGDSAMEYQLIIANGANLRMLNFNQILATPKLLTAQMCEDGTCVRITFDSLTNRGGLDSIFPCFKILQFPGARATSCQWIDDRSIAVAAQNNLLSVGSNIAILRNTSIFAKCLVNVNCSHLAQVRAQNITIMAPSVPLVPQVVIVAPSVIDICSSLVLDASNSYGFGSRLWKSVTMIVSDSNVRQPNNLQSFLDKNYSVYSVTPIPKYLLTAGHTYTFSLSLCNFLGYCSSDSHIVQVVDYESNNGKSPIVSIPGQKYITMVTAQVLSLRAVATTQLCDGTQSSEHINYTWHVSSANGTVLKHLQSISRDDSRFELRAYTLMVGFSYRVTVNSMHTVTGLSSNSSVFVTVQKSGVVAVLQGNMQKYLSSKSNLTLDASQSRDSDVYSLRGVAAGLLYSWSCVQILPTFKNICPVNMKFSRKDQSRSEKLLIIAKSVANITLRVTVTVFDSTRSSAVYNDIVIRNKVITTVSVDPGSLSYPYYVSVNSSLQLTGLVMSSVPCAA